MYLPVFKDLIELLILIFFYAVITGIQIIYLFIVNVNRILFIYLFMIVNILLIMIVIS